MATPTMNARLVAELVSTQFPKLSPVEASYLGEGCDSVAFVVNRQYVFRFPKRDDVEEQLLREMPLMAALAPRLPIAIPRYEFVGQPSAPFSRHFGGYPLIDGTPAIHLDLTGRGSRRWPRPSALPCQACMAGMSPTRPREACP